MRRNEIAGARESSQHAGEPINEPRLEFTKLPLTIGRERQRQWAGVDAACGEAGANAPRRGQARDACGDLIDERLETRSLVSAALAEAAAHADEQFGAHRRDPGDAAVPAREQAAMEQPIVADEQRPVAALGRRGEEREILRAAAAVLDADDVLLLFEELDHRAGLDWIGEVR